MRTVDQDRLVQTWDSATSAPSQVPKSPEREHKLACLRHLALLRFSGRIDEMMSFFAEDCELYVAGGAPFSPFSGRFHGRQEISRQMAVVNVLFEFVDLEFISVIIENDDIAIRWKCQARQRRAGSGEWLEGMSFIQLVGDQIRYYGNFLDTGALARIVDWTRVAAVLGTPDRGVPA